MKLDPLLYDVQYDADTGEMSFYDKAGGLIYSCVLEIENEEGKPLTFEALEDGSTVALTAVGGSQSGYQTSLDGGTTWGDYSVTGATPITLNVGEKVCFRIKTPRTSAQTNSRYVKFVMSGQISASGNCNSMITPDFKDLKDLTTVAASYGLRSLFYGCASLVRAPMLPATTLADYCYYEMFSGCTGIVQAPMLPATTLADYCYSDMFSGCTGIVQAPMLPATTLADSCYYEMFRGCTNLTQAPTLPSTTLAERCYAYMFGDCTSLTQAPALPATTLANRCYLYMFRGCTSLTQAPELPATVLKDGCYYEMFLNCTALAKVVCYATDISAAHCIYGWLNGVSATGDFYADPSTEWNSGIGIPSGWTRHDIAELEA